MTKRYGLPYKGSKNAIASRIVDLLPAGGTFVDLFCGGCAVTHAAMESGKWSRFLINDIDPFMPRFFLDAIDGRFAKEKRWISREDFYRLRDSDSYVKCVWSFGNNGMNYLYSKEVESWKKALHFARVFSDTSLLRAFGIHSDGSRSDIVAHEQEYKEKYIKWYISNKISSAPANIDDLMRDTKARIQRNQEDLRQYLLDGLRRSGLTQAEVQRRLGTQMARHYFGRSQWEFPTREMYEKMRSFIPYEKSYDEIYGLADLLNSLQSLQSLQRLPRPQDFSLDYRSVPIPLGSLVYADPPYAGTDGYNDAAFDHAAFWEWVRTRPFQVYVSEYSAPPDFFPVFQTEKISTYSAKNNTRTVEKLFLHRRFSPELNAFAGLPLFDFVQNSNFYHQPQQKELSHAAII